MSHRLTLRLTHRAWEKLYLYVCLADGEVGGLGAVVPDGPDFVMTDCFLIEQRATDVDMELEPAAVSHFLVEYVKKGGDPTHLRLWWHSHARESVFWSADDERTIQHFGGEMLVSVVGNHAGKFLARLDRFEPRREPVVWLDFVPPAPPPALHGPAAQRVRSDLSRLVHLVPRHTNKLWTNGDLPRPHF